MDQQREQASQIAHEFIVYQESEQADIDAKDHQFDALWQSIYDVCKLIKFGIIEDITEEEFEEAYAWLKTTQSLTEDYQELDICIASSRLDVFLAGVFKLSRNRSEQVQWIKKLHKKTESNLFH